MGTIPVGVIEGHPLYRAALAQVLGDQPDLELDGVAESVARFRASRRRPGGVVVLDLQVSGPAAVLEIARMGHRVLVVSAHASRGDVFGAIAAGACGYLCKDADGAEVLRAVRLIAAGKGYASPALAALLPSYTAPPPDRPRRGRRFRLARPEIRNQGIMDWLRGRTDRRSLGYIRFVSPA